MPVKTAGLKRSTRIGALVLLIGTSGAFSACAPIVDQRGYVPSEGVLETVQSGVDTRASVVQRLGRPSALGTFDSKVWYYISERQETIAFYAPETTDRTVVAVKFNDNGTVDAINKYGLEDGQVIDLVSRQTPTRGKETSILRELFGNIGRFNEALGGGLFGGAGGSTQRSSR